MSSIDEVIRVHRVERLELQAWIDQKWVRPRLTAQGYSFDDMDEARILLIRELRHDFLVNEEALGIVLDLLDQVYAARRVLREFERMIDTLPEPARQQLRACLPRVEASGEGPSAG